MNPLTLLGNLFGGNLLGGANSILGRFFVDKDTQEANVHSEQQAAMQEQAAEFTPQANRTWWDSFVDGLNRLPRPIMAFGVLALLVWAPYDPIRFAAAMQAYSLIPQWLTLVMAQIILLFFGGRMLDKWPTNLSGPSADQVKSVLANIKAIRAQGDGPAPMAPSQPPPTPDELAADRQAPGLSAAKPFESDSAYRADMADTRKPLSNASILEWNRRRQAAKK